MLLATLLVLAALSRLLPHPPNFAPMVAMALFGGAFFADRRAALWLPLAALALSDIVLAGVRGASYIEYLTSAAYLPSLLATYAATAACAWIGLRALRGRASGGRVLGAALGGTALFFLLSNFAVWLTAFSVPGYPACNAGLLPCYVAALPFLKWSLAGTLVYAAALFGGFALLRSRLPALRAQTV